MEAHINHRIVVVNADAAVLDTLGRICRSEGDNFHIVSESDSRRVAACLEQENPGLVIVGPGSARFDCLKACRKVRESYEGPILMIAGESDAVDEMTALEHGADLFLTASATVPLLVARIRSLLRLSEHRAGRGNGDIPRVAPEDSAARHTIDLGWLVADAASRVVRVRDEEIDLTSSEFDLLWCLGEKAGQIVTRDQIFTRLFGVDYDGLGRSVDQRVARLRKKLGDDGRTPQRIKSIRSMGYLLVP